MEVNKNNNSDFFELLNKLQSSRLDDQRCSLPPLSHQNHIGCKEFLSSILKGSAPYPLVDIPSSGNYWIEPQSSIIFGPPPTCDSDLNECARSYRAHFLGYEHYNFCGETDNVVLSLKTYGDQKDSAVENHIRVIIRTSNGTIHKLLSHSDSPNGISPQKIMNLLVPDHSVSNFTPVLCPIASELIMKYDEHLLVNHNKFGIIYQKIGQTTEEALFGNRHHCSSMEMFLNTIGKKVVLSEHKGYRGGLDTQYGQTGMYSIFETFQNRDIMFHVSTYLPYTENDPQQLQRKRHIGNDIVAIIFQEGDTPFCPEMITSHFLHAYIVVRPILDSANKTWYKVAAAAKSGVPYFGPKIPTKLFDSRSSEFKEFLLTKLINAETACFKADKFSSLESRTRHTLLMTLHHELLAKTDAFMDSSIEPNRTPGESPKPTTRLLSTVRRALKKNHNKLARLSSKSSNLSGSQSSADQDYSRLLSPPKASAPSIVSSSSGGEMGPERHFDSGHGSGYGSSPDIDICNAYSDEEADDEIEEVTCFEEETRPTLISIHQPSPHSSQGTTKIKRRGHTSIKRPKISSSEVVSGHITMITVEGDASTSELSKLKDEISKLKSDKLEMLRQNVEYKHELQQLTEREKNLRFELANASREIRRLKTSYSMSPVEI